MAKDKTLKIGIDLDSTLNCLDEAWIKWIQRVEPDFNLNKWTSWDVDSLLPVLGKSVYSFLDIRGAFKALPPRVHSQEVVERLKLADHELFCVTSTVARNWPEKSEWLKKHFPQIPEKNHIVTSRKGLLKLDVLVDDGLHNFEGFEGLGVIYDRPWNRKPDPKLKLKRIEDWREFEGLLK